MGSWVNCGCSGMCVCACVHVCVCACVLMAITGVIREEGKMLSFCLREGESSGEGFLWGQRAWKRI